MPVDRAERRRRMRRRETIRWARSLAIALAAALILRFFVLDFVRIAGVSMNDTLMTGDIALATKFDYWFSTPQRGDIALIRIPRPGCRCNPHRDSGSRGRWPRR